MASLLKDAIDIETMTFTVPARALVRHSVYHP